MPNALEVEIDESGAIHPLDATIKLPQGRAILILGTPDHSCYLLSELALADWLRPEEDEAWAYIQPQNQIEPSETKV
jgi:hypothetical protein